MHYVHRCRLNAIDVARCLCVCLCVGDNCAKTTEQIEMPFAVLTQEDPRNHEVGVLQFSSMTSGIFRTPSSSVPLRRPLTQSGVTLNSPTMKNQPRAMSPVCKFIRKIRFKFCDFFTQPQYNNASMPIGAAVVLQFAATSTRL